MIVIGVDAVKVPVAGAYAPRALPLAPLREFKKRTGDLPRAPETARLVMQRVGQNVFRGALMDYWGRPLRRYRLR
jgi:hypothetical protein